MYAKFMTSSSVLYIDFHRWDKITDLNNLNRKDLC